MKKNDNYRVIGTSRAGSDELLSLKLHDYHSISSFVIEVKRLYGTVDILINNVGSNIIGSVLGTSDEEVSYQMKVNYKGGAVRLTKMLLPDMLEKKNMVEL